MIRRFTALGVARLVAAAVQALALIAVARFVPVATFGELSVVLAIVSVVFITASAGLAPFILRERAKGDEAAVRGGLRANLLTTAGAGVLLAIAAGALVNGELLVVALALVVAVGVDKTVDSQLSVPIADGRMRPVTVSVIGRALVTMVSFVGAILLLGQDLTLVAYALARVLAALFAVVYAVVARDRPTVPPLSWRLLARRLWPLAGANTVAALRGLDVAVVLAVSGSATAGLYSAANRPFAPASIVAGAAGAVFMPHSATAEWPALAAGLRRLRLVTLAATAALVPVAFAGPALAVLLYGEDYAAAGAALGVCLVVVPAVISAAIVATVLQARGQERFVLVNSVIFLGVFLVGLSTGALAAGATGAAFGYAVSVWGRNLGLAWGMYRLRRMEEFA